MEGFAILLSIPVALVANTAYCAFLNFYAMKSDLISRLFVCVSWLVLGVFSVELLLLASQGVVRSRTLIGPAFSVAHFVCFLLGSPALADVLSLGRRGPLVDRWYLIIAGCTAFALFLVVQQYVVSEALYGPNGTEGPFGEKRVGIIFSP
ncbi:hypothetical protein EP7_005380 [Isosphaeraceae bacterium EP7]